MIYGISSTNASNYKTNVMINLKFPCSQKTSTMQETSCGFYCSSCEKEIHDFRGKSVEEINDIRNKSTGEICGVFDKDHVRKKIDPRLSMFRTAFILVFVMGLTVGQVFGQSDTTNFPTDPPYGPGISIAKVDSSAQTESVVENQSIEIRGRVIDDHGEYVAFAKVIIEQNGVFIAAAATDFDGHYKITIDDRANTKDMVLRARSVGYGEVQIILEKLLPKTYIVDIELSSAVMLGIVGIIVDDTPAFFGKEKYDSDPYSFGRTTISGDDLKNRGW